MVFYFFLFLHLQAFAAGSVASDPIDVYSQKHYQPIDPEGDLALYHAATYNTPIQLWYALTGNKNSVSHEMNPHDIADYDDFSYDEEQSKKTFSLPDNASDADMENVLNTFCLNFPSAASIFAPSGSSSSFTPGDVRKVQSALLNLNTSIQGRENPINAKGFHEMFAEVINEELKHDIKPSFGEPEKWSPEFLTKHPEAHLLGSKLMMALALGRSNRFLVTGAESTLNAWILFQPKNSITIPELFRASYITNNGDVYKTLLTIENVLSHEWRNPNRESLPVTVRLKPITSGFQYSDDRFGSWYHLFGVMLFGYSEGKFKADMVGMIEAVGSHILAPSVNKSQKAWINRTGGDVGADLALMVKSENYTAQPIDETRLQDSVYLNQGEDFRDRISVPLSSEINASVAKATQLVTGSKIPRQVANLAISSSGAEKKNCTLEIMFDRGNGFRANDKVVITNLDIPANQQKIFSLNSGDTKRLRGFVTGCEGQENTEVFETH